MLSDRRLQKSHRETFREEVKKLIKRKVGDSLSNYPNWRSVRLRESLVSVIDSYPINCRNCDKKQRYDVWLDVTCLNGEGNSQTPQTQTEFLFNYCARCGYTTEKQEEC
jgi:hypothetical protein